MPIDTDFVFANHGSLCILTAITPEARDWESEYLPDDAMRWGGGVVIEPRYVDDILNGIADAGLTVS